MYVLSENIPQYPLIIACISPSYVLSFVRVKAHNFNSKNDFLWLTNIGQPAHMRGVAQVQKLFFSFIRSSFFHYIESKHLSRKNCFLWLTYIGQPAHLRGCSGSTTSLLLYQIFILSLHHVLGVIQLRIANLMATTAANSGLHATAFLIIMSAISSATILTLN